MGGFEKSYSTPGRTVSLINLAVEGAEIIQPANADQAETEADYLAELDPGWDIILADYNLPQFTGLRALELMKERGLDIPFIIISAALGEDKAIEAMRAGASDYVMKDKLGRLLRGGNVADEPAGFGHT